MAKKKMENIRKTHIATPGYIGLVSEMPQDAKDKLKAEKPEAYKMVFGDKEPEPEMVQE